MGVSLRRWLWAVVGVVCGMADNGIGDAGARAVAEALKANSTLTSLDLSCECVGLGWREWGR